MKAKYAIDRVFERSNKEFLDQWASFQDAYDYTDPFVKELAPHASEEQRRQVAQSVFTVKGAVGVFDVFAAMEDAGLGQAADYEFAYFHGPEGAADYDEIVAMRDAAKAQKSVDTAHPASDQGMDRGSSGTYTDTSQI